MNKRIKKKKGIIKNQWIPLYVNNEAGYYYHQKESTQSFHVKSVSKAIKRKKMIIKYE